MGNPPGGFPACTPTHTISNRNTDKLIVCDTGSACNGLWTYAVADGCSPYITPRFAGVTQLPDRSIAKLNFPALSIPPVATITNARFDIFFSGGCANAEVAGNAGSSVLFAGTQAWNFQLLYMQCTSAAPAQWFSFLLTNKEALRLPTSFTISPRATARPLFPQPFAAADFESCDEFTCVTVPNTVNPPKITVNYCVP